MANALPWRLWWLQARALLLGSLPNRCLVCHQQVTEGTGICGFCLDACCYQGPVCLGCGRSLDAEFGFCAPCRILNALPVVAGASYHRGLGHAVAAIKYQGQFAAIEPLCRRLASRVQQLRQARLIRPVSLLLPVPLHPARLRQRGFNQAYEIAKELSRQTGIAVAPDLLGRCRNTPPQAGLDGRARRRNLQQAFVINGVCSAGSVALVDDVVTTGSTASAIATLLEAQGVSVQVWCLARAEAPGLLDEAVQGSMAAGSR